MSVDVSPVNYSDSESDSGIRLLAIIGLFIHPLLFVSFCQTLKYLPVLHFFRSLNLYDSGKYYAIKNWNP